jgi:S1-C subfamily serine protease
MFRLVLLALLLTARPLFPNDSPGLSAVLSKTFVAIARDALPAVVQIVCEGENGSERQGSGFFISVDGCIATNAHLIQGSLIQVLLHDKRTLPATILLLDADTDLAVLKVEGSGFPFLVFGDSDKLEVGEIVLAAGCPFDSLPSLTMGLVGATKVQERGIAKVEDFIQTNTLVHLGNSGGPLLNLRGEVVGINTASLLSKKGVYLGSSLAISSRLAAETLSEFVPY